MARGWESKSVEAQIESADTPAALSIDHSNGSAERKRLREKNNLMLSRQRVLQEIQASSNPRFHQMLHSTLEDLDKKLAQFE